MGCARGTYGDEENCKEDFVWKLEEKISWKTKKYVGVNELVWEVFIVGHVVIAICSAVNQFACFI